MTARERDTDKVAETYGSPNSASADDPQARRDTVVGLFQNRPDAEAAISDLKDAGFPENEIGVAMRDRTAQGELIEDTGTQAAEGATAGLLSGGAIGGILGALIGAGALAIPGIGPVLAGGALASAFGVTGGTAVAGAGIGAASGGILGGLIGAGIPKDEAEHFERGFKAGGILLTVKAAGRGSEALDILRRHDADLGPAFGAASGEKARIESEGDASVRMSAGRERARYSGPERRYRSDPSYSGTERRLAGV